MLLCWEFCCCCCIVVSVENVTVSVVCVVNNNEMKPTRGKEPTAISCSTHCSFWKKKFHSSKRKTVDVSR